jgi:hypothetical protein
MSEIKSWFFYVKLHELGWWLFIPSSQFHQYIEQDHKDDKANKGRAEPNHDTNH